MRRENREHDVMRRLMIPVVLLGALLGRSVSISGEDAIRAGGRVNNLKVLSDKIDDVTTVENILKSFVKPGMSDAERAKALWTAVVKYRHQSIPPDEALAADWEAHDPVKIFNVYGYCMCCCSSATIEALNRADGREARGRILNGHSVPEIKYGDSWHMYDASLITMFPEPESGAVASVDEIAGAVAAWYRGNPGYRTNESKLRQLMQSEGWMGWKSHGPKLLANCTYYDQGWFPARTHGWYATMMEYDRKCEVYEYGYQTGHRALFSLRPGESIVRAAGNRGMHVNMDKMPDWDALKAKAPLNDLVYVKDFFPGYTGGVVANGYHRYAPDLASGELAAGAEVYENLEAGGSPALHLKAGGKPGIAIVQMSSPYVYLGGRLRIKAVRPSDADRIAISLSTNNGRTFTPLWVADKIGVSDAVVDLKDTIRHRYNYWLKIEIASASPAGAGLEAFSVESDIQHAPRTLPWLGKGGNTIRVAADADPALSCRTVTCRITPDANFARNESSKSMGVVFENLNVQDGACWWKAGVGTMTVPVETPGDLAALRLSVQVRVRGEKDLVKVLISCDAGKTWQEAGKIAGPTQGTTRSLRFATISDGSRKALVRFELSGNNTIGVLSLRIDADYRDPLATGAFRPFDIVHRWKENGREKRHKQAITKLPFTYRINTIADPEMVSVTYEMASGPSGL